MAIFVEDAFAKEWVESIIRNTMPDRLDEIGAYAVSGDSQAHSIHQPHRRNPAVSGRLKSVCILDGNSTKEEDRVSGIIKLPGDVPESEVFNYVSSHIDELSMQLAVTLHLSPEKEDRVKAVVKNVSSANRDPHLLFNQVDQRTGLIPASIVSSAFIGLWLTGNEGAAKDILDFIAGNLDNSLDIQS